MATFDIMQVGGNVLTLFVWSAHGICNVGCGLVSVIDSS